MVSQYNLVRTVFTVIYRLEDFFLVMLGTKHRENTTIDHQTWTPQNKTTVEPISGLSGDHEFLKCGDSEVPNIVANKLGFAVL